MGTQPKPKGGCLGKVLMVLGVLFVIIIVVAAIGGGSKDSEPTKTGTVSSNPESTKDPAESAPADTKAPEETPAPEETDPPKAPEQTVFHVGDILQDGDTEIVYAASGVYHEDNQYMQPEEGQQYIFLKLAFLNRSNSKSSSVSFYSFECYADGYACEAHYLGDQQLSASMSPGRSTIGYLYFSVPVDAQHIEVEYETNVWTEEKITFVYDGDKDSGYELEKNTAPTEGALQVGETVETDDFKITFLDCFADTSDNMFIQPAAGYQYVTIQLEVENIDDSDHNISYFSFHGYADGAAMDITTFRDDSLSATLSAGRKAKGSITFEVPVDAKVIEFEYDSSLFGSHPVVFNAMPG